MENELNFEGTKSAEVEKEPWFWIGPDVKIDRDCTLEPNTTVMDSITIRQKEILFENKFLLHPSLSVRSILAQLGVEAGVFWDKFNREGGWRELESSGQAQLPILLINHGHRPVRLEEGDGMFRFFDFSKNIRRLENTELANDVANNEIIKGVYGQEWWFIDEKDALLSPKETDRAVMVCLPYDANKRLWVPPDEKPIHITQRDELEQYLQPAPPDADITFFVAETTARVQMEKNPGLLSTAIEEGMGHRQLSSNLIDPQFGRKSGGVPIRMEILDPIKLAKNKPCVYMEILSNRA